MKAVSVSVLLEISLKLLVEYNSYCAVIFQYQNWKKTVFSILHKFKLLEDPM